MIKEDEERRRRRRKKKIFEITELNKEEFFLFMYISFKLSVSLTLRSSIFCMGCVSQRWMKTTIMTTMMTTTRNLIEQCQSVSILAES
jgi:DNA-binding PadR family transcriptional regulator